MPSPGVYLVTGIQAAGKSTVAQPLRLRYELAATVTDRYAEAGFTVIVQDVVLGEHLPWLVERIRSRPLYVIVLAPDPPTVATRDRERGGGAYAQWQIGELDRILRERTPRIGLWLDTAGQTPDQTAAEILDRAPAEATVSYGHARRP